MAPPAPLPTMQTSVSSASVLGALDLERMPALSTAAAAAIPGGVEAREPSTIAFAVEFDLNGGSRKRPPMKPPPR